MMKRCLSFLTACLLAAAAVPAACAEGVPAGIAEAIAQETSADYVLDREIPFKYQANCLEQGTVEEVFYPTKDYFGDGSEYTKRAFVYLPYGYSADQRYKVLVLCHGIGGSEYEWGMTERYSKVRMIMDRLIMDGDIEPFIVVTPNGKAGDLTKPGVDPNTSYMAFYPFGQELRNDLLPWIDEHYSTYGSGAAQLSDARDYRAMAGLSMGGMQTINIGMCECLDLFSWFGAFSACPTTYPAGQIVRRLADFPAEDTIHYFYNLCGSGDKIAYGSASQAAKNILPLTDRLTEANFAWQERTGGHDFAIWYLGFFNFARIFGAKR